LANGYWHVAQKQEKKRSGITGIFSFGYIFNSLKALWLVDKLKDAIIFKKSI